MKIRDFKLEVFFNKYEFTAPYLLSQSDCESMSIKELLGYEKGADKQFLEGWLGYTEVPGHPELRKRKSVLLLPANIYMFPGQYCRMGFGRKNFAECLAKFEEYLIEKSII